MLAASVSARVYSRQVEKLLAATQRVIACEHRAPQLGDGSVWQTELLIIYMTSVLTKCGISVVYIRSMLAYVKNVRQALSQSNPLYKKFLVVQIPLGLLQSSYLPYWQVEDSQGAS